MWQDLSASSIVESGTFAAAVLILLGMPSIVYVTCRRYVWATYPADEKLHCNGSTLTISRIRWLDFHNVDWRSRQYAMAGPSAYA